MPLALIIRRGVCVCLKKNLNAFVVIPFILDDRLVDVPAGVTREETLVYSTIDSDSQILPNPKHDITELYVVFHRVL